MSPYQHQHIRPYLNPPYLSYLTWLPIVETVRDFPPCNPACHVEAPVPRSPTRPHSSNHGKFSSPGSLHTSFAIPSQLGDLSAAASSLGNSNESRTSECGAPWILWMALDKPFNKDPRSIPFPRRVTVMTSLLEHEVGQGCTSKTGYAWG